MDPKIFVITIVALVMVTAIIASTIRAFSGRSLARQRKAADLDADRKIDLVATENGELKNRIMRLEARIAVLERIATDKTARLSEEIDALR